MDQHEQTLEIQKCLNSIMEMKGKEYFRNGRQLSSALIDLMPTAISEATLLSHMGEHGVLNKILSADESSQAEKERLVYYAIDTLVQVESTDKKKARQIVCALVEALGWNITEIERRFWEEAERQAREEACRIQAEIERKAQEEARKIQAEIERKAREAEARRIQAETERKAREDAARRAREEAERRRRETPNPQPNPGCGCLSSVLVIAAMIIFSVMFYNLTIKRDDGSVYMEKPDYDPNRPWEMLALRYDEAENIEADLRQEPFLGTGIPREQICTIRFKQFPEYTTGKEHYWDVSEAGDQSILLWAETCEDNHYHSDDAKDMILYDIYIGTYGTIKLQDCTAMFKDCVNLWQIYDSSNILRFDEVSSMRSMYENCKNLYSPLNLSNYNITNVTNMSRMFAFADIVSLSIENEMGDLSSVKDMSQMFLGWDWYGDLDLSQWNTTNVTNMEEMFAGCSLLRLKLAGRFNTANVTNMQAMFYGCKNLEELHIYSFNTSNVSNMSGMFSGCSSLQEIGIEGFDTSSVVSMDEMFAGCGFSKIDISKWNTSSVTSMARMFQDCEDLEEANLSNLSNEVLEDISGLFSGCKSLKKVNLKGFMTPKVKYMDDMFRECGLETVDLSRWNTSSVTSMARMFSGSKQLKTANLNGLPNEHVEDMSELFSGCTSLKNVNLRGFETPQVKKMAGMFQGCTALQTVNLNSFKTETVTDMQYMFYGCATLNNLNLTQFDTSQVTNMASMFENCAAMKKVYLGTWETDSVQDYSYFMNSGAKYNGKQWEELFVA